MATDVAQRSTRVPKLKDKGPKYYGAVVVDPEVFTQTDLPVMEWFVQNATAAQWCVRL